MHALRASCRGGALPGWVSNQKKELTPGSALQTDLLFLEVPPAAAPPGGPGVCQAAWPQSGLAPRLAPRPAGPPRGPLARGSTLFPALYKQNVLDRNFSSYY